MAKEKSRIEVMRAEIDSAKSVEAKLAACMHALDDGNELVEASRAALSELLVTSGLAGSKSVVEINGLPYSVFGRNPKDAKDDPAQTTYSLRCSLSKALQAKYDFTKKA